jgi:hypothetical protein
MSLIYSMLMSVDGHVEDEHGRLLLPFSIFREHGWREL